jgi:hypothetical protein
MKLVNPYDPSLVISDGVWGFCMGGVFGISWGIITTFDPIDAKGSFLTQKLRGIGSNGLYLGGIVMTHRFTSSCFKYIRRKDDVLNEFAGFGTACLFGNQVLLVDSRRMLYKRVSGAAILGCFLYANLDCLRED